MEAVRAAVVLLLAALPLSPAAPGHASRSDGSRLVYAPSGRDSAQNPAFSPDGGRLLFTRFHGGYNRGRAGLATVPAGGGRLRRLLDEPGQQTVNLPGASWNAATGRIVFASDRVDRDEIWTADGAGTNLFRVTDHATGDGFIEPSFSPDGEWIAFEADSKGPQGRVHGSIWKVRADGSELQRLASRTPGGVDDREPNWSPRGDRIVFQRRRRGLLDRDARWDLYVMRPDGMDLRRVTSDRADDTDASWSAGGRLLVYSSDRGGLPEANLFVIPADGGSPVRVTRDRHYGGAPSWSPDGRWIAFESSRGNGVAPPTALWRIRAPLAPRPSQYRHLFNRRHRAGALLAPWRSPSG